MSNENRFITPSEHHNGIKRACLHELYDGKPIAPCTLAWGHKGDHEENLPGIGPTSMREYLTQWLIIETIREIKL